MDYLIPIFDVTKSKVSQIRWTPVAMFTIVLNWHMQCYTQSSQNASALRGELIFFFGRNKEDVSAPLNQVGRGGKK